MIKQAITTVILSIHITINSKRTNFTQINSTMLWDKCAYNQLPQACFQ